MEFNTFANLVLDMRKAQKEYFRHRNHTNLRTALGCEKRIDEALARLVIRKLPVSEQLKF